MEKEFILTDGYDPDKYRDDLCESSWKESGAKTIKQHFKYLMEQERKLIEKLNAEAQKKKVV